MENQQDNGNFFEELLFGCSMDLGHFHALRNNFILSCAADAADVPFGEGDRLLYYRNALKQNFSQRGIPARQGFSYERLINLASSVDKKSVCEMLDKIINYALKDLDESEEVVFQNSTFDFVDHFMRESSGKNPDADGRTLMEKNLVGIHEIKQQVHDVVNVMKYNQMRNRRFVCSQESYGEKQRDLYGK